MPMTTGERIKQRRKSLCLSAEQIAERINVSPATIYRYEKGDIEKVPSTTLIELAAALHTTPAYLMGWEEEPSSPASVRVPVLGKVAAGLPITAVENILDYEEIPFSLAKTGEFVALQIKGQSMEPRIFEGDVVIIRVQPTAETGDLAVVIVNGDEATVKKIKFLPEGILLQPFNPTYQPMFYSCSDIENKPVRIFGKVVELRAKF